MAADDRRLIVERLRSVYLFRTPREIDFDKLAGLFELVRYPAGYRIVEQGARGEHFYIIDQGQVEITRRASAIATRAARPRGSRAARLSSAPPPAPAPDPEDRASRAPTAGAAGTGGRRSRRPASRIPVARAATPPVPVPAGPPPRTASAERSLAILRAGDYFGEAALMLGERRTATVTARTDVQLLRVDRAGFQRMLTDFPELRPRLAFSARSYGAVRAARLPWLESGETILIFARKHKLLLVRGLALPVLALVLLHAGVLWFGLVLGVWWVVPYLLLTVAGLFWSALAYVDWYNDYYVITSRRVLHEERVLLLYESRTEAPLYTLRTVKVNVDPFMQAFRLGDVILQTFSGTIQFRGVQDPQVMADLALDLVERERRRQIESERTAIRGELLKQMGLAPPAAALPETQPVPPVEEGAHREHSIETGELLQFLSLRGWLSFPTRVESQGVITYRRHPWVLLTAAAIPAAALLSLAILGTWQLLSRTIGVPAPLPLDGLVCSVELLLAVPFVIWLYYRYEDWRNDIYQVTDDSIFDIERRPFFGREDRRQAPLGALLNVQVVRPNPMAILFNFGNLVVQTGGETGQFTFDSVADPLAVQHDIWRKFEELQTRQKEDQQRRQREEMAKWFGEYHRVLEEHPPGD